MKSIELYNLLIEKTSAFEAKLLASYAPHIRCRRGCSRCCILGSVFPVEAFNIFRSVSAGDIAGIRSSGEDRDRCVFLSGGECSIYAYRPVICRTHGYPVFVEGRVDFCPDNFRDMGQIDSGCILDLEALNMALASVNIIFRRENREVFFSDERITLAALKEKILADK